MCGIAGIINRKPGFRDFAPAIKKISQIIQHRGPDGDGVLVVEAKQTTPFRLSFPQQAAQTFPWIPKLPLADNFPSADLFFLHRRLAIIDLSEGGHQPMCDADQKIWLTYNGEIYNYRELRQELESLGYVFLTASDTEVIIAAYKYWGTTCTQKFNGMWAFMLYDKEQQICFASRDRLGVKPFFYYSDTTCFAFASEQKALVKSGLVAARANETALSDFLVNAALEREPDNFFEGITELFPGEQLIYNLQTHLFTTQRYYKIEDHVNLTNNHLSDRELVDIIRQQLDTAVQLRLRSDVPVGTCLSGGIDSSALAVMMARHSLQPVHCFTAVFKNEAINEEAYAESVVLKIRGIHHKTEPDERTFLNDLDELIYSQDVPIWSTSTYAQHRVMKAASETGIKVVLDGQGADELFAGYHHHFFAKWNSLAKNKHYSELAKEIFASSKSIPQPLLFFIKQNLKKHLQINKPSSAIYSSDFAALSQSKPEMFLDTVNDQLLDDITRTRLKIFLKCEDRAGMWHSVESRTPFADDINLIETAFTFSGERKIQNGVSKYFLREAARGFLPEEIYNRYDKKGFETPMQQWLQPSEKQFKQEIIDARLPFVNSKQFEALISSRKTDAETLFRLLVYVRWKKLFTD